MDNGMENMLDMYLYETNTLLERLDEILLDAEKTGTFSGDDVNEIFRIMHTIKGSSAMMEFNSLMTIAHRIEDLFFAIREKTIDSLNDEHKQELFDLMFRSTDYLRAEVEKVENGEPLNDNIDDFVNDVNSFLNKISTQEQNQEQEQQSSTDTVEDTAQNESNHYADTSGLPEDDAQYYLIVFFDEGCGMENLRAFMLVTSISDVCEKFNYYPDDVETSANASAVIGEKGFILSFLHKDDLNKAITVVKNSSNVQTYEVIEKPKKEVQNIVDKSEQSSVPADLHKDIVQSPTSNVQNTAAAAVDKSKAPAASSVHPSVGKQSLISVNLTKLDKLLAIVGEIVITESMVTSSPDIQGIKLDNFTKSARQLRKLTDDLQDIAMSIRMVPVSGVFQKMNRIVRDMGHKLNKNVKLTIIGENTEVDKTIVDSISDPIMHIVRNSMDHGIEDDEEERIINGKSTQGEIVLSAKHTGSEVIISVEDDGKGIDPVKVLEKARNNGILTKPESEYSLKETLALLMMPGFSTNEIVTEFSGRGVGMDVVKKNVEKVGGTVIITSEKGNGTCTTMKIPLTLAIVDGMEISVGKSIFTIPINNIRQSFKASAEEVIYDTNNNEIVERMGNFYPIIRLHELYNIETEITNIEDGILVWMEQGEKSYCLFVDELVGEQQVVVKPLPTYLNGFNVKNSGIAGCTILGDGNISIILDILSLYDVFNNTSVY